MAGINSPGFFENTIRTAIAAAIEDAISEEEERAVAAVRQRIRAQKATIAMAMMRHFDIYQGRDSIVITVKDTVKD